MSPNKVMTFLHQKNRKLDNAVLLQHKKIEFAVKNIRNWFTEPSTTIPTKKLRQLKQIDLQIIF